MVQKDPGPFVVETSFGIVQIGSETNAAPVAGRGGRRRCMTVQTDRFVQPGREVHRLFGGPQHLQSARAAVGGQRRTAHADPRLAEFENRAGIDHHRDVLRNRQVAAVVQVDTAQCSHADLVRQVVPQRQRIAVQPRIGHDPHQVARSGVRQRLVDLIVGIGQRTLSAVEDGGVRLVDVNRLV